MLQQAEFSQSTVITIFWIFRLGRNFRRIATQKAGDIALQCRSTRHSRLMEFQKLGELLYGNCALKPLLSEVIEKPKPGTCLWIPDKFGMHSPPRSREQKVGILFPNKLPERRKR